MFTINISGLQKSGRTFMRAFNREIDDALESAGELAVEHVKKHSKFRRRSGSGSLKDATKVKFTRLKSGRIVHVRSTKKTAKYLEYGTPPHKITAGKGKMLRFVGRGGRVIFRKSVNHKGTKPTKFLWNATNAAFRFAGHTLKAGMTRAAKRF